MRDGSIEYYERLFGSMEILPDWTEALRFAVAKIRRLSDRYMSGCNTDIYRVPWEFVAAIHYRECANDMKRQILNGERWDKRTTLVPRGLGPWDSWEHSTQYCIKKSNWNRMSNWTTGMQLKRLEQHNGGGYMRRGFNSPYLWSGSNHGLGVGKYVADGHYSPSAVDKQIGAALIIHQLLKGA